MPPNELGDDAVDALADRVATQSGLRTEQLQPRLFCN